jgi:adenosylcobyric acid synthase
LRAARVRFAPLAAPWHALSGVTLPAYEIRCGRTTPLAAATPALHDAEGAPIGWQAGSVLGIAAHGLFEDAAVLRALFGAATPSLDDRLDGLADLVDEHLGAATLRRLMKA